MHCFSIVYIDEVNVSISHMDDLPVISVNWHTSGGKCTLVSWEVATALHEHANDRIGVTLL